MLEKKQDDLRDFVCGNVFRSLAFSATSRMDWVQLHLALNHVPVIATPILVLLLAVGWLRKNNDLIRAMLWSITFLALASIAIKFTGDFAAEQLIEQLAAAKDYVSRHEEAGDQATTGVFFLGIAAALALFLARRGKRISAWTLALVLLFGIVTAGLYFRSGHTGGQISHPELRESPGQ